MTTLQDIIDNRERIEKISEKLGILNLRLINVGDNTLNLLVSINREVSSSSRAILLEAKLIEMFDCETAIIVDSRLKSFVKESVISGAVPISETQKLEKLFNDTPKNINFDTIILSGSQKFSLQRSIMLADKHINNNTAISFFNNSDQKINDDFGKLKIDEDKRLTF